MSVIRILIVDDEERLLRVLRLGLKPLNYEVQTAANGDEALKMLLKDPFDIVLTDLRMTGMKGDELVYEMERLNLKIPTIIMTAYADVETAIKTLKHGAVDYLRKPFTVEDVDVAVRQVLSKSQAVPMAPPETLKDGVEKKEKELIEKALLKSNGNKILAAQQLNISERTLWYKVKKYKIGG